MMKKTPGPRAPPVRSLPSLKMTALSYSWTTWQRLEKTYSLLYHHTDLDGEEEGEGECGEDDQDAGQADQEGAHPRALLTGSWNYIGYWKHLQYFNLKRYKYEATFNIVFLLHNGVFTYLYYISHQVSLCHVTPKHLISPYYIRRDNYDNSSITTSVVVFNVGPSNVCNRPKLYSQCSILPCLHSTNYHKISFLLSK